MKKLIFSIFLSLLLIPSSVVYAFDEQFFSENDILFYNPDASDVNCSAQSGSASGSGASSSSPVDYTGKPIFNDARFAQIEQNKSFYEQAANEANIPWQMIAAIHFKETGLKRYNPANGNGPYQILNTNYPSSSTITDEVFLKQTKEVANLIKSKATDQNKLASGDAEEVKNTFFRYNGAAQAYVDQAQALGFGDKGYEGSPYVMNKADEIRDPDKNKTTWGQIKVDGGGLVYPANPDYGAFVVFAALSGVSITGTAECINDVGNGQLVAGGMTLAQARAFEDAYKNGSDSINYIGGASRNCYGGALSNCVSFSVYFINKYTDLVGFDSGAPGNGKDIVTNIKARNPGIQTGKEPHPYAIFSVSGPGWGAAGHTGVVLGVDEARGVAIIGEAHCDPPASADKPAEYSLAKIRSSNFEFAYTEGHLKGGLQ